MKNVSLFIDVSNLYHSINRKYPNEKIDYNAYMDYCRGFGDVDFTRAYGSQNSSQAEGFFARLKKIGFEVYSKDISSDSKISWDSQIIVDCLDIAKHTDLVILGSASGNFVPLITRLLNTYKVKTVVLACGISKRLESISTCIEIPRSLLL